MDVTNTAKNTAVNFLGAATLSALTAFVSTKVSQMPNLTMNAAVASAILGTTGGLVGSTAHGWLRGDNASPTEKLAALAFFALAFNGISQVAPLTDKVSFLRMGRNEALILSIASTAGVVGGNALYNRAPAKTPYEAGVEGIEAAGKLVNDTREALKTAEEAHKKDTANKDLKTAFDDAQKPAQDAEKAWKDILSTKILKDDETAKYEELNKVLFPKKAV